jgi:uncharacterized protein
VEVALFIGVAFLGAAVLYSSVGHGGASAYLAIMALAGIEPTVMRPTALILNIVVAGLVTARFARAGQLPVRQLAPFLLGSVPLAFVGGSIVLPVTFYKVLVGLILLVAAVRFWVTADRRDEVAGISVGWLAAAVVGGAIGLLAGLTGTGGGIFLTPLVLLFGWAPPRGAAALSAGFVLVNSIAGLAGNLAAVGFVPPELALWLPAVVVGALIGSELGVRRFSPVAIRRSLAVVLVVAGLKLILIG